MPMELAVSLAGLALYDTVIFVDDSGTLSAPLQGRGGSIMSLLPAGEFYH